eukprot:CAMPEP_0117427652 /NCGR_PEP_ID=MMETSP0758-20121206/7475_1 /TAXON_ID=63605 /ORGANISM="Percolomonas cosmopolitus, Strain AE-1 (ATCC 50343)" /LENGTH=871 /DNA_ID=CAMNT_0005213453 /DNA_START=474 /DNA_END=3085 /DNA_ORIENTATION=-
MDYRNHDNVSDINPIYDTFFKGIIIWTSPHKQGHDKIEDDETEKPSMISRVRTMGLRCLFLISFILCILGGILFLVFFAVVMGITHTSYPHIRGTVNLSYANADGNIIIERDAYGVPHIKATSMRDLSYGQGYAEAQDRLFQLDITRRAGRGTLSGLVGTGAFDIDELGVTLQLEKKARASYAALSNTSKTLLTAYVDGINAYIDEKPVLTADYTMVFDNRTVQKFEPFETLISMYLLGWRLSANARHEIERMKMIGDGLTPARVLEVVPPANTNFTVLLESELTQMNGLSQAQKDTNEAARNNVTNVYTPASPIKTNSLIERLESNPFYNKIMDGLAPDTKASNNWVIGGQHTDSGFPFLANDPHLTMTSPSPFYLKHLVCESCNLNAIGAGVALIPSIVIGKTDKVAWGITAAYTDVIDLYKIAYGNSFDAYNHQGTSKAFEDTVYTLRASNGQTKKITVRETVYGPLVSNIFGIPQFTLPIAMHWGVLDSIDTSMDTVLSIVHSENVDEFTAAINANVTAIPLNFVVVDSSNNTAYALSGKIPNRPHSGLFVMNGNGDSDPAGFLPRSAYPVVKNPPRGWIASANNRVVPHGYPHNLGYDAASIYRASRIHTRISEAIDSSIKMNITTLRSIQLDSVSSAYLTWNSTFDIFNTIYESQKDEVAIYSLRAAALKEWNGNYSLSSEAPMLFEFFLRELRRSALPTSVESSTLSSVIRVTNLLSSNSDDVCGTSSCRSTFVINAFRAAVDAVETRGGLLSWGLSHVVEFPSTIYDSSPLKCFASRQTYNAIGGSLTVNVAPIVSFNGTLNSYHGPSYRQLITMNTNRTLGDADSFFVVPTGNSGNMVSPFYDNLISLWRTGEYMNMSTAYS